MKTNIYFFSGTGNSLHVAKELGEKISDAEVIPMTSLLGENSVEAGQRTGFVFPIHLAMAPAPVVDFVKRLDLSSTEYIFAVATRAGSRHRVFKDLENILTLQHRQLDSSFTLNMGSNDPKFKGWKPPTSAELETIDVEINKSMDFIAKTVVNNEKVTEKDIDYTNNMPFFPVLSIFLPFIVRFFNVEFYSDGNCSGCGTCSRICLSNRIRLADGKSEWMKDVQCYFCNACLNFCPESAVQIKSTRMFKSYTQDNGRYSHPYADVGDVAAQKMKEF